MERELQVLQSGTVPQVSTLRLTDTTTDLPSNQRQEVGAAWQQGCHYLYIACSLV